MTYGDVVRAGISNEGTDIIESGNYLLNDSNNSYPLVDDYYSYFARDSDGHWKYNRKIYYVENSGLMSGEIYTQYRKSRRDDTTDIYSLVNQNGDYVFNEVKNSGKSGPWLNQTFFLANSVKPAIIIDLTNKKLDGDGTLNKPFLVVDKD